MINIILASGSERRRALLNKINLPFKVQPSQTDETYNPQLKPGEIVQMLARRKASDVARQVEKSLVIGADTLVVFKNRILEKPRSAEEAREMLLSLNNNTHHVFTGVALCKVLANNTKMETTTFVEKTAVSFGNIEPDLIEAYISSGSPMDKAGSYGIQDSFGAVVVNKIEGDYNNVVGFPLFSFYQHLKSFAPEYLELVEI